METLEPRAPLYKSWGLWTAVGVAAAVAAGVAIGVRAASEPPFGTLGRERTQ